MPTRILLLETCTDELSVGVSSDTTFLTQVTEGGLQHAALITVLIQKVLAELGWAAKSLDAVAISIGPGSYTSLRVGLSAAKGLCFATDTPLLAVDTLAAVAEASYQQMPIAGAQYLSMIDARRQEVYLGSFADTATWQPKQPHTPYIFNENSELELGIAHQPSIICGNGAIKAHAFLPNAQLGLTMHRAEWLCAPAARAYAQGLFEDVSAITPFYLKPPNITTPKPFQF